MAALPGLPGMPAPAGGPQGAAAMPRWKREFGWSVSRQGVWERCRRAFYYAYVAPKLPRPPVPFPRLEALLRLSPQHVVKGQAVHAAVEAAIAEARAGRPALRAAERALDAALRPYARAPAATLAEVHNGAPFDAAFLEEARADGRDMLQRFAEEVWPRYAARRYLHHEELRRFEARGVRVWLRLDLLTAGPEGLLITDWKTGRDHGDHDASLQLGTYILWATRAFREAPERVAAELVFLGDGAARGTTRTAAELAEIEARIAASAAAMLQVEDFSDAPPSPGAHCGGCRFATICDAAPPGEEPDAAGAPPPS